MKEEDIDDEEEIDPDLFDEEDIEDDYGDDDQEPPLPLGKFSSMY